MFPLMFVFRQPRGVSSFEGGWVTLSGGTHCYFPHIYTQKPRIPPQPNGAGVQGEQTGELGRAVRQQQKTQKGRKEGRKGGREGGREGRRREQNTTTTKLTVDSISWSLLLEVKTKPYSDWLQESVERPNGPAAPPSRSPRRPFSLISFSATTTTTTIKLQCHQTRHSFLGNQNKGGAEHGPKPPRLRAFSSRRDWLVITRTRSSRAKKSETSQTEG